MAAPPDEAGRKGVPCIDRANAAKGMASWVEASTARVRGITTAMRMWRSDAEMGSERYEAEESDLPTRNPERGRCRLKVWATAGE